VIAMLVPKYTATRTTGKSDGNFSARIA
jgi:hypothetical protein